MIGERSIERRWMVAYAVVYLITSKHLTLRTYEMKEDWLSRSALKSIHSGDARPEGKVTRKERLSRSIGSPSYPSSCRLRSVRLVKENAILSWDAVKQVGGDSLLLDVLTQRVGVDSSNDGVGTIVLIRKVGAIRKLDESLLNEVRLESWFR